MAKLVYSAITSLDGYVADADGEFDWAAPDEEVHTYVNDLEREIGTYLLGRRMYEVMVWWEDPENSRGEPPVIQDYAQIWKGAEKVVYSTTLEGVSSEHTRIERRFEPEEIRRIKEQSSRDVSVGGAHLAAEALRHGLVDECHLFLTPVVVGGGTASLPEGVRLSLDLLDEHRFGNGVVHLHYRVNN